ncbi:hypothetical protein [Asticcacaulis sp. 201]|uniref:hypothetical protein n=1 Tax=Asticcacaulis sp. 201 TaxID=3028787 RepID=UPI002916BE32|nr:hypothetical protein [Asticcacaulis sp. 201]MDV6329283.1 hypothetical protein [Asticcacaulis sp. 201]
MTNLIDKRALITGLCGLVIGCALALPAQASGGGEGKEGKAASAPSVQLGAIGIPVTVDGKVVNYIFLSIKINLSPKANEAKMRDMEPYFRDALVRVSSRVSFAQTKRDDLLDEARFKQVMTPEWSKITGAGMITSIDIVSQSPKRHPK